MDLHQDLQFARWLLFTHLHHLWNETKPLPAHSEKRSTGSESWHYSQRLPPSGTADCRSVFPPQSTTAVRPGSPRPIHSMYGICAYIVPPNHPQLIGIYGSPMECLGDSDVWEIAPWVFARRIRPSGQSWASSSARRPQLFRLVSCVVRTAFLRGGSVSNRRMGVEE